MRRASLSLGVILVALTACTASNDAEPPAPTSPAASTPTPPPAAQELTRLAGRADQLAATLTYQAKADPQREFEITAALGPPDYRLDIIGADGVAALISGPAGTVSCNIPLPPQPTQCFLVGPASTSDLGLFDPGVQRLFAPAIGRLAAQTDASRVTELAPVPAAGDLPAARCFSFAPAAPTGSAPTGSAPTGPAPTGAPPASSPGSATDPLRSSSLTNPGGPPGPDVDSPRAPAVTGSPIPPSDPTPTPTPSPSPSTARPRGLDPGTVCLSEDGVLRSARFPAASLELSARAPAPDPARFTPPASPVPVPSS